MKNFYICLTFDTDPDPINEKNIDDKNKDIAGWEGLDIGKDRIFNILNKFSIKNIKIPTSWFVRVDDQIKYYHGKETWLLQNYSGFWKKIKNQDGCIQWHIHFNKKFNNEWKLERSKKNIISALRRNFNSIKKYEKNISCVRIGEAYFNKDINTTLRKLKIKADCSALPGRSRSDGIKLFDWSKCLNQPYFMSKLDYQKKISNLSGKKDNLLEIPMNTINTKCSYDKKKILRYCNLAFKNKIFSKYLNDYIKHFDTLVTMTHPFEIAKEFKTKENSQLISFSINEFEKNILSILKFCKLNKKKPIFMNINKLVNKIYEL